MHPRELYRKVLARPSRENRTTAVVHTAFALRRAVTYDIYLQLTFQHQSSGGELGLFYGSLHESARSPKKWDEEAAIVLLSPTTRREKTSSARGADSPRPLAFGRILLQLFDEEITISYQDYIYL